MSYKLALHVLAMFTEQVAPIHKHITFFWTTVSRYPEQK